MAMSVRTDAYVDELIDATSRLILNTNEAGNFETIEALPSKVAPPYLRNLIKRTNRNEEDTPPTSSSDLFDSSVSRSLEELQMFKKKVQDEDRLSNMYKLRHNFSSRFDNRAYLHPHGTTNFDYHGIPVKRQAALERYKNRVRKENYMYLGNHPEIQGIISLFLKKLLTARPQNDAADYLAEFFATRLKDQKDFEEQLQDEVRKISRYHVGKMRASGKINWRRATDESTIGASGDANGQEQPEVDVNFFKKMNIGPLAADFSFDPSCLMSIKKKNEEEEEQNKLKQKRKKKKSRKYCGCKDWKLKKNRQPTAESSEGEKTTTFSTMGNVATLRTSEEEETEEEEEEEKRGDFMARFGQGSDAMSESEAERIASQLVHQFLDADGGVYSGHHHSLGEILKNIQ